MLIRVKRKRDEAPLDCLLVEETEQRSNKKRGDGAGIASLMESLSTAEQEQKAAVRTSPQTFGIPSRGLAACQSAQVQFQT